MNKTTIVFLVVLMVALVGCSDKPSDYNTYTAQAQNGQDSVGGGCGLVGQEAFQPLDYSEFDWSL